MNLHVRIQLSLWAILIQYTVAAQQSTTQLWTDYVFDFPFANSYLFEAELNYKTQVYGVEHWESLGVTPQIEYNLFSFVDILLATPITYTVQTETVNTFEIDAMPGARFYLSSGKRVETRITVRWQERFLKATNHNEEWEHSGRLRIRGELIVPINRGSYYTNKQLYGIIYCEGYFSNKDVSERFANRVRINTGLGYRINYNFRVECIYILQESRNELTDINEVTQDNIIRLRLKHYINRSRPPANEGDNAH